jgi:hypothetical protein
MLDYSQGKIYKLYIGDLLYIGSTAQPRLSMRFAQHKNNYKQWIKNGEKYYSSFELFKIAVPTIELIELFPCGSKDELNAREGYHQRVNDCVNKQIAGRSKTEYGEAYYQANRPQIVERKKVYYEANRQRLIERQKVYNAANRPQILEQKKADYAANRPKFAERNRAYYAATKRTERLMLFIQKHILTCHAIS